MRDLLDNIAASHCFAMKSFNSISTFLQMGFPYVLVRDVLLYDCGFFIISRACYLNTMQTPLYPLQFVKYTA